MQTRQTAKVDTNGTNLREAKLTCPKGATEISPGLEHSDYPG